MELEDIGKRAEAGQKITKWRAEFNRNLETIHTIYATKLEELKLQFPDDITEIETLQSAIITALNNKANNLQGI